jgi:outer membrane cobalamin receptor
MKYRLPVYLFTRLLVYFSFCWLTLFQAFSVQAQKYTISGYVKDSLSSEALIGANIHNRLNLSGASANSYGFYSLTLPAGNVELMYSYVGYNTALQQFHLQKDTVINVYLGSSTYLQEVTVTTGKANRIQDITQMSAVTVPVAQIKALPALLGETDVMKVLQLMPGVQSGGEGTGGLYVRGGGPDQNLILLDGVPLYNVSHLFGFLSVFNADAINHVELFKGGFPARYGGRASSVVDVNMKEGNMQQFHGEGSIGLVSAKMAFEGPIIKDRTSFIVSARRTYIDLLLKPFIASQNKNSNDKYDSGYYFYDVTAKINHRFSANDRIYLSLYMGDDKFYSENEYQDNSSRKSENDSQLAWSNIVTAFRWNHIFTNKLFGNTTFTYSRYLFRTDMESWDTYEKWDDPFNPSVPPHMVTDYYAAKYNSGINDWSGKIVFDYLPSPDHHVRFGGGAIHHTFNPGALAYTEINSTQQFGQGKIRGWEYNAYAEDDIRLTGRLKANIGLHWSGFSVRDAFYSVLQPRFSARYLLTDDMSLKASYSRMAQYIHLLANSNIGLPTDLWVPSTDLLRPQTSHQAAFGLARNFREEYEISLEGYYKTIDNVLEYKEGASFLNPDTDWEKRVLQGEGRSYGLELFVRKNVGTFTGWLGYTLSWTDRRFEQLNEGKRFPYKYDRRHDISLALLKRFGKKIELSGVWVFGTGNSISLPVGVYQLSNPVSAAVDQNKYYDFGERNGYRMNPYHRLDLSISFLKQTKWGERRWIVGVYNAYSRKNPFYIDVQHKEKQIYNGQTYQKYEYLQYSLFPIIPSVSYQFKF